MRSLFGLAPGGVCRAGLLPGSRCALTAPFHPCLIPRHPAAAFPEGTWPMLRIVMSPLCGAAPGWRGPSAVSFCCTFRRLAPPRRYLAPCPVEPGLSSACLRMTRLSGRLRRLPFYGFRRRVSGSHEIRFSYSKPGASTPGGAAAAGATASASGRGRRCKGKSFASGGGRRCKGISSAAWFRVLLQHAGAVHPGSTQTRPARTKSPCSDVRRGVVFPALPRLPPEAGGLRRIRPGRIRHHSIGRRTKKKDRRQVDGPLKWRARRDSNSRPPGS